MNQEFNLTLWQLLMVIGTTFITAGGLSIGLIGMWARAIRNDPLLLVGLETAAKNIDPDVALKFVEIGKSAAEVGTLIEEVFDGTPAAEKK